MESFWQDLRHGLRGLTRQPGFSAAALLTLALGIGANVAIFGVAQAALLAPLPFPDGDRLVRLFLLQAGADTRISLAPETFTAIRDHQRSFASLVAHRYTDATLLGGSEPRRVVGMGVTEGWAETLGVRALLGRTFSDEDDRVGGVVVLSYALWQSEFGADPAILGRSLRVNGEALEVIGVLGPGFEFPYSAQLWFPMLIDSGRRATWGLNVQARLAAGVTREQAEADLAGIARGLAETSPGRHRDATLIAVPTREGLVGDHDRVILLLLGAVGFVMLIACANVANLLLARAVGRQREMAIRGALGASRGRQLRQLLTESLLLAGLGGGLGLVLAWQSGPLLAALLPERLRWVVDQVPIDSTVLGFALAATLASGVLFGLAPALRASRLDLDAVLRESGRGSAAPGSRRLLDALVVGEVALALMLVAGAGLMIRNLHRLQRIDLGYDSDGISLVSASLDQEPYTDPERRRGFLAEVERRLTALPGVSSVGGTCLYPLGDANFLAGLELEGRAPRDGERLLVNHRLVTPGFLPTLGVELRRGRLLEEGDRAGAPPVVVVNESLARRYWPGQDPLERRVRNRRAGEDAPWMTVVGVVADVREFDDIAETWYLPYAQHAEQGFAGQVTFAVRAAVDPGPEALRHVIRQVDPTQAAFDAASVRTLYGRTLEQQRFGIALLGSFAGFGLLLAGLGLYAVLSYAVGLRAHEIGIRMALGARPRDVLRQVLGHGGALVATGLVVGTAGAFAVSGLLVGLVSEVEPLDTPSLALALVLLALVGLQACYLPARRAMRCDPVRALREE